MAMPTHEEDKYICPYEGCKRSFPKRWSLTRHLRKHTGEKPFRCSKCNKEFVERCGLVRHEQTHAEDRHWECDIAGCNKKFKLKEYLDIHKKTWHAKNEVGTNSDFSLRNFSESTSSDDTTQQLRQRLVHMSIRHREMIYLSEQREAELLSKLKQCSIYLQSALDLLPEQSREADTLRSAASRYLVESIAIGSGSSDSGSEVGDARGPSPPLQAIMRPSAVSTPSVQLDLSLAGGSLALSSLSPPSPSHPRSIALSVPSSAPAVPMSTAAGVLYKMMMNLHDDASTGPGEKSDTPEPPSQNDSDRSGNALSVSSLGNPVVHITQPAPIPVPPPYEFCYHVTLPPLSAEAPSPILGAADAHRNKRPRPEEFSSGRRVSMRPSPGDNIADIMSWIQGNPEKVSNLYK